MQRQEQIKGDVEDFLRETLRGCASVERGEKFEGLLFDVLVKIWDHIKDRTDKIGIILFAEISSLFTFGWRHSYTPADSPDSTNKKCLPPDKWIIYFPGSVCDQSEAEIKQTITHEFAHFMLGHDGHADKKTLPKGEKAADDLAAKWGFPYTPEKETKRR